MQAGDSISLLSTYSVNDEVKLSAVSSVQRASLMQGILLGTRELDSIMHTFYELAKAVMRITGKAPEKRTYTSLDASMGFKPSTTQALNELRLEDNTRFIGSRIGEHGATSSGEHVRAEAPALTPAQRMFAIPGAGARLLRPPGQSLSRGGLGPPGGRICTGHHFCSHGNRDCSWSTTVLQRPTPRSVGENQTSDFGVAQIA